MTAPLTSPLGGDDLAKALRDAYGQGGQHAVATARETATAYREKRDAWIAQYMARLPAAEPIGRTEQDAPVQWGDPKTVAGLIAQLRTLPPDAPIYGTFHGPDFPEDGLHRTGVRGVTLSREYVKGRWLSRAPDAELQHVIWTKPAEPEEALAPSDAPSTPEADR